MGKNTILFTFILFVINLQSQDKFIIKRTNIDHKGYSYGLAYWNSGLIYSEKIQAEDTSKTAKYQLVYAEKVDDIIFGNSNNSEFEKLNISINIGSPSIYQNEMYFTSNITDIVEYKLNKREKSKIDKEGNNNLQIYKSTREKNGWSKPEPLALNNSEYNYTNPHISKNGQMLFFASDKPNGFGGYDIYLCKRLKNNTWSAPLNLGGEVNSSYNEMFPSFYNDKLYFSSKRESIGGANIYYSNYSNTNFSKAISMAALNSSFDDFGVVFIDEFSGYFSSNREGSTNDNTFFFINSLSGSKERVYVKDEFTNEIIKPLDAYLSSDKSNTPRKLKQDINTGEIELLIPEGESKYRFEKNGYIPKEIKLSGKEDTYKLNNVTLTPNFHGVIKNDINGKPIQGMRVSAYDSETGELIAQTQTNENGEWGLPLDKNKKYDFKFEKSGYDNQTLPNIGFEDRLSLEKLSMQPILNGTISNFITGEAEPGVLVQAIDPKTGKVLDEMITEGDGKWALDIPEDADAIIKFKKDGFTIEEKYVKAGERGQILRQQISSTKIQPEAKKGNKLEIRNIYFDFGKADIRSESNEILDNIVAYMTNNPNVRIELSAHTDSRGSTKANQKLSSRRAESAYNYIISKGIESKRLVPKGYGESQLSNKCADGVKCTEEEHQQNRRVEMKIL